MLLGETRQGKMGIAHKIYRHLVHFNHKGNGNQQYTIRFEKAGQAIQEGVCIVNVLQNIQQQDRFKASGTKWIGLGQVAYHIHFRIRVYLQGDCPVASQSFGEVAASGSNVKDECTLTQSVDLLLQEMPVGLPPRCT